MKNSDETLNQLLKSAGPVSPRRDFAQHIIAQAAPQFHVQNQVEIQTPENNIFKQIIRGLIFPKPGYALACSMLVGILLGWQSPELTELATGALTNTNIAINPATVEEDLSRLFLAEVSYYE